MEKTTNRQKEIDERDKKNDSTYPTDYCNKFIDKSHSHPDFNLHES